MHPLRKYTAYARNPIALWIVCLILPIVLMAISGVLMDSLPDLEDLFVIFILFGIWPITYVAAMFLCKSELDIIIQKDKLYICVVKNKMANSFGDMVVTYTSIRTLRLQNSAMAGSYLLLQTEYGAEIKLYSKQVFFNNNNDFYDMFEELKQSVAYFKKEILPNTALPPAEQPPAIDSDEMTIF